MKSAYRIGNLRKYQWFKKVGVFNNKKTDYIFMGTEQRDFWHNGFKVQITVYKYRRANFPSIIISTERNFLVNIF